MDLKNMGNFVSNEQMTKLAGSIQKSTLQMPDLRVGIDESVMESIRRSNSEKRRRETENHENLQRIAIATEDLNAKFDYVAKDLDYILSSLGANFQRLENLGREEKEVLGQILGALQMQSIEDGKPKIKELLADKGVDFVISVVVGLIQLKMTGN